ncbi:MAG: hypothetical protein AAB834_05210, partial [Patescibacteria group bacterium]
MAEKKVVEALRSMGIPAGIAALGLCALALAGRGGDNKEIRSVDCLKQPTGSAGTTINTAESVGRHILIGDAVQNPDSTLAWRTRFDIEVLDDGTVSAGEETDDSPVGVGITSEQLQ